ncbi:MAG TPA: radical SAM protein [Ohtaekwangia sp.]|uniref:B12-binding domain-containing radical SAM protein n=1 Tax=Ohtaekwangia sp. TaxID=2066019 RepID=UPI002F940276
MNSPILFTHSYFYKFDPKQWRFKQPYPPLATILAAAVMREAGFPVALFDTALRDTPVEITKEIEQHKPKYLVIYDDGFNYLTKMCLTNMREAAFAMARMGKDAGCTVIASSSDAADHYEKYFQHGVDYVVRGEGEETLKELILGLEANRDVKSLPGIAFSQNEQVTVTPTRPVIRDLDVLPLPAWDLVDIDSYRAIWRKHHGYFSLNIATTRGCPYKCNWCAKPIYGNRYNSRSPQHVIREIEFLLSEYKPDHFWMCDDIFGLKPGWVQEFRDRVRAKNLIFKYKIQSRADLLLQEDTIEAFAQSGAETIWIGAESGSQKILDAMDKGTTVRQIHEATHLMKQKGIKVAFFLQFGYLGETQEDIDATLAMVLELMPDEVGISVSYPLPGTKFYDKVKAQLHEKQNWSDSDDLAMMFQGTFGSKYYKELHRYVHSVYRKRKGYMSLQKLFRDPLRLNYKDLRAGLATFYYIPTSFAQRLRLKGLTVTHP